MNKVLTRKDNHTYTTTTSSKPNIISILAHTMIKNRLYIPQWSFYEWLRNPVHSIKVMVVCWDLNTLAPIGLGILCHHHSRPQGGIFVRKAYRRQHIGSTILKMLTAENNNKPIKMDFGNTASEQFYPACVKKGINVSIPRYEDGD